MPLDPLQVTETTYNGYISSQVTGMKGLLPPDARHNTRALHAPIAPALTSQMRRW